MDVYRLRVQPTHKGSRGVKLRAYESKRQCAQLCVNQSNLRLLHNCVCLPDRNLKEFQLERAAALVKFIFLSPSSYPLFLFITPSYRNNIVFGRLVCSCSQDYMVLMTLNNDRQMNGLLIPVFSHVWGSWVICPRETTPPHGPWSLSHANWPLSHDHPGWHTLQGKVKLHYTD